MQARTPAEALVRKLRAIGALPSRDEEAIRGLTGTLHNVKANQDIVREGERPKAVTLVVEGFLCRYKIVADGKRQIFSFHIPGDIPDLQSLFMSVADHSLCTLAPSKVILIPHQRMLDFLKAHGPAAELFWRDTLIDAAVFREWMASIGRRNSFARIAHLICELIVRMQAVGLANAHQVNVPLTQMDIADALGITTVHVNRTLQELRAQGLIKFTRGSLNALDWPKLKEAGEFDPLYLHLSGSRDMKAAGES